MTSLIAVVGATGTLGSFVVDLVQRTPGLELHAALSSRDDLDDVRGADLVVDVTHPAVSPAIVEHVVRAGIPVLVGTSGWNAERVAKLRTVVADVDGPGVLVVPNFSLGSVLATRFATMAARFYESVEILEAHHEGKVDSPSGTAVRSPPRSPTSARAASRWPASRCTACASEASSPSRRSSSAATARRSPSRTTRSRSVPTSRACSWP